MLAEFRQYIQTKGGRYVVVAATLLLLGVAAYALYANLGADPVVKFNNGRVFICAETKKAYNVTLKQGMKIPYDSPYSGKATGYPAELCYWTKDGKIKQDPTPVLLNSYAGKPEPTFCPDCGRLVTIRNPFPEPGSTPPPTQADYNPRNNRGG